MSEPTPAHEPTEPNRGNRQRRRSAVLALAIIALVMGGYQGLRGDGTSTAQGPLRFTMQTVPRPLPAIVFSDGDGRVMDLAQLRGKVILLNIWATWCSPCRKEMPSLDRLQGQLGGKDFEVVALSIDTGDRALPAIRTFYASGAIRHLHIYHDPRGVASVDLGSAGVPTTLLLDREGRELGRMTGAAEWDTAEANAFIGRHITGQTR